MTVAVRWVGKVEELHLVWPYFLFFLFCYWEKLKVHSFPLLSRSSPEEDDSLSLVKDNSHNSSFELPGSMITSYQPVNNQRGTGRSVLNSSIFRSPSPCLFRPSFLGSASKVRRNVFHSLWLLQHQTDFTRGLNLGQTCPWLHTCICS